MGERDDWAEGENRVARLLLDPFAWEFEVEFAPDVFGDMKPKVGNGLRVTVEDAEGVEQVAEFEIVAINAPCITVRRSERALTTSEWLDVPMQTPQAPDWIKRAEPQEPQP